MPPPNITGRLHLGHALFLTLQDAFTRYHRLSGQETLWLPGTDHAGLATDAKLKAFFDERGECPEKDAFMKKGWDWKDDYHRQITGQIKAMGASCDWERERYTLDDAYLRSSTEALKLCEQHGMLHQEDGQWYLDMTTLAGELLAEIESGGIEINTAAGKKTLIHFLENLEPWCISRQIWWGQQLPVFREKSQTGDFRNRHWVAQSLAEASQLSGLPEAALCQEQDSLDTWFLSSLWPFATLGWPDATADYHRFYPADLIETADDIIFYWCARMLMMGKLCTGKWPFRRISLHGIVRDKKGQKMSKSLGKGIDPLAIIDELGCDALRWGLASQCNAGHDSQIGLEDMRSASQLMNKLWQSARFILGHARRLGINKEDPTPSALSYQPLQSFLPRYHRLLRQEQLFHAAQELHAVFKHDFCDRWIEDHKELFYQDDRSAVEEGLGIFKALLMLFHPFIPFITEKLYGECSAGLLADARFASLGLER